MTFTSIFPGCCAGRWPHIHFEVYATDGVFSDGAALELATCSGRVASGITAALTLGI